MLQRNPHPLGSSVVRDAFQSDTEKKTVIQELWTQKLKGTCVPSRYSQLSRESKDLRKNWEDGIFAADLTHEGILCGLHSCRLPEERWQANGKQGQRRTAGSWDLCYHFFLRKRTKWTKSQVKPKYCILHSMCKVSSQPPRKVGTRVHTWNPSTQRGKHRRIRMSRSFKHKIPSLKTNVHHIISLIKRKKSEWGFLVTFSKVSWEPLTG